MNLLATLKYKLSHVSARSWHYRFVKSFWGPRAAGKACTYYWIKLPSTFLVAGLALIILLFLTIVVGFFGFVLDLKKEDKELFYPYKTLPSGRKVPVAPWEIVGGIGVLYALYYLAFVDRSLGMLVGLAVLALFILAVLSFVLIKIWQSETLRATRLATRTNLSQARDGVSQAWDTLCPPLIVEDNQEPQ